MAIVIDGLALLKDKRRLPTEAFFVDTNIVIAFKDPFGQSSIDLDVQRRNLQISEIILFLKSNGFKGYSTISVALEYYKYIQVSFFNLQTESQKFDSGRFKELRDNNAEFMIRWDHQISVFKKVFRKNFPLFEASPPLERLVSTFEGSKADFGDHTLFHSVMSCARNLRCIFSNDADFYTYLDEFYLLTTNQKLIRQAKNDKKLLGL